ncbi:MAG TPA: hypothetical protein VKT70_11060 [Stellaceae bacterium]|nr:hypothetical protein [Stellaceae bacterium]
MKATLRLRIAWLKVIGHRAVFLSVMLLVLVATPGRAGLLGDASIPFSADRTLTIDGRLYDGRVYQVPGHARHEQELRGTKLVVLLDAAAAHGTLILPGLNSYVDFAFPKAIMILSDEHLLGASLGYESIDGIRTTKYRVDRSEKDGTRVKGVVWRSSAGIVMKLEGTVMRPGAQKPTAIKMELSNLELGPQDSSLFAVPPGLVKLPPETLKPLLGRTDP